MRKTDRNATVAMLVSAVWILTTKDALHAFSQQIIDFFMFGSLSLSVSRTLLLPGQMFERHQYTIERMIEQKAKAERELLEQARRDIEDRQQQRHASRLKETPT